MPGTSVPVAGSKVFYSYSTDPYTDEYDQQAKAIVMSLEKILIRMEVGIW